VHALSHDILSIFLPHSTCRVSALGTRVAKQVLSAVPLHHKLLRTPHCARQGGPQQDQGYKVSPLSKDLLPHFQSNTAHQTGAQANQDLFNVPLYHEAARGLPHGPRQDGAQENAKSVHVLFHGIF
jgi:hypothetical protein